MIEKRLIVFVFLFVFTPFSALCSLHLADRIKHLKIKPDNITIKFKNLILSTSLNLSGLNYFTFTYVFTLWIFCHTDISIDFMLRGFAVCGKESIVVTSQRRLNWGGEKNSHTVIILIYVYFQIKGAREKLGHRN